MPYSIDRTLNMETTQESKLALLAKLNIFIPQSRDFTSVWASLRNPHAQTKRDTYEDGHCNSNSKVREEVSTENEYFVSLIQWNIIQHWKYKTQKSIPQHRSTSKDKVEKKINLQKILRLKMLYVFKHTKNYIWFSDTIMCRKSIKKCMGVPNTKFRAIVSSKWVKRE